MENSRLTSTSPKPAGRQPAEWAPHRACWLAWPSAAELWQDNLSAAQAEFAALCAAIAAKGKADRPQERLEILVMDPAGRAAASRALNEPEPLPVRFHEIAFGDIWLRDTAPIFLGAGRAVRFAFNGWGRKYELPYDNEVAPRVAQAAAVEARAFPWVLEGGSVDVDGEGTCLTTRQCLLNPNRNEGTDEAEMNERLHAALGTTKVLWLEEGLINDHTDGHIDTLARFIAPGVVMCMIASDEDDPNAETLARIACDLASFTDAKGRSLEVITVPSPGKVVDESGKILPASYMNFYIGNHTVVVPTYGSPFDAEAVEAIAAHFADRRTVGLSAKAILSGGGAFHCITQQEPLTR